MWIERTFVILKPDAIRRGLQFEVLDRIRNNGFIVVAMYMTKPSMDIGRIHYDNVFEKAGTEKGKLAVDYLTSGPVIVAIVEGENAVQDVRRLAGTNSDPRKCAPGTIRFDYIGNPDENIIHTSDSHKSAEREIDIWFRHNDCTPGLERSDVYGQISRTIDYTLPDLIEDIVKASNAKKILYHGVKNRDNIENIKNEGIKPLTPESGPCSFWSTGIALFEPQMDSPFFCYAGGTDLRLAMAGYDSLSHKINAPEYRSDSQIIIKDTVPFDEIALLSVDLKNPSAYNHIEGRRNRQLAEQILLQAIIAQLYGKFTPGEFIEYVA